MSDELKHTPGPLTFDPETNELEKDGGALGRVYSAHDMDCVASASDDVEDPAIVKRVNETAVANGYLWAGSPGLLAACRRTLDWLSSFSMPPTGTIQEKQEAMLVLMEAIAAATTAPKGGT